MIPDIVNNLLQVWYGYCLDTRKRSLILRRGMKNAITLLAFLGLLMSSTARAQYACDVAVCTLPDCHCASTQPPGGLTPAEVPQFLMVTFDDAIHGYTEELISAFMSGLTNPNGRLVPMTYFTNVQYTVPEVARGLYVAGHELANHTATHTTSANTDLETWRTELATLTAFLVHEVGMREEEIVGFRAPFLETNQAMWEALEEFGFLYESSIPEQLTTPPIVSTGLDAYVWPHTLDYGAASSCLANACPTHPIPGLWTIPMWQWEGEDGFPHGVMDPATSSPDLLHEVLTFNFQQHYSGNRAPLGLYLHAGQSAFPGRPEALRAFLEGALAKPNVWLITMRGLIEWMRAPVPASEIADWFAHGCDRGLCRGATGTRTESDVNDISSSHELYPNPTSSHSTLVYYQRQPGSLTLEIYDVLGRVVHREQRSAGVGPVHFMIPLAEEAPGVYFYRLSGPQHVYIHGTVLKQH